METKTAKFNIEKFDTLTKEGQKLAQDAEKQAQQMMKAISFGAPCVTVILACFFIIEICRRNMPGLSFEDFNKLLPFYMVMANGLLEKEKSKDSQEDE